MIDKIGHRDYLVSTRDRVLAFNAGLSDREKARIFGVPYRLPAAKEHHITVDLKAKTRTVESREVSPLPVKPQPPAPPIVLPPLPLPTDDRPQSLRRRSQMEMRTKANDIFRILRKVTGFSTWSLKETRSTRLTEVTLARWLFFAMLRSDFPNITYHDMKRPMGCDHSTAFNATQRFPVALKTEVMKDWLDHPAMRSYAPRLRALETVLDGTVRGAK